MRRESHSSQRCRRRGNGQDQFAGRGGIYSKAGADGAGPSIRAGDRQLFVAAGGIEPQAAPGSGPTAPVDTHIEREAALQSARTTAEENRNRIVCAESIGRVVAKLVLRIDDWLGAKSCARSGVAWLGSEAQAADASADFAEGTVSLARIQASNFGVAPVQYVSAGKGGASRRPHSDTGPGNARKRGTLISVSRADGDRNRVGGDDGVGGGQNQWGAGAAEQRDCCLDGRRRVEVKA